MKKLSVRDIFSFNLLLLSIFPVCLSAQEKTMKEAFEGRFLIGAAVNAWDIRQQNMDALNVVKTQFSSIVAENCMKAGVLSPVEGEYRFDDADRFVEFGTQNGMAIIGHCLVWHSQPAKWFFKDEIGNPVTREVLIQRMRDHIYTVVGRYRGRVFGWDVVNEAVESDGSMRKTPFYEIIGDDYIRHAFQFAHEADPDAELYYNDYGMDGEAKRETVCRLIRELKAAGCRIDAVGMQSHVAFDTNLKEYEKSLEAFAAEGVKVSATELDLSVLPWPSRNMGAAIEQNYDYAKMLDPYKDGLPDTVAQKQTDFMCKLFDIYLRHSKDMERVTFWGVSDRDSWKNNWPINGRTDYPLAFDRQYKMKPFTSEIIKMANRDNTDELKVIKSKQESRGKRIDKITKQRQKQ